jgi:hypothetical protein
VPIVRIPSPRATDGRALRRIFIDSRDLDVLIERWKEVNTDTSPTDPTRTGGPDGNALQTRRCVVDQVLPERPRHARVVAQHEGARRQAAAQDPRGDIEHGLPVDPKLNRIRFEEAAEDLKTEYAVNGRRSADELERRIRLHLMPHFGGRRLATIRTPDINTFILKRQDDVIVSGEGEERKERRFSNGEINRELTTLKRIFNLARQNGKLTTVPHIPMLKERNVRTGFFEREQMEHVLAHLPPAVRRTVQFAYITGWRIPSEVLRLQ